MRLATALVQRWRKRATPRTGHTAPQAPVQRRGPTTFELVSMFDLMHTLRDPEAGLGERWDRGGAYAWTPRNEKFEVLAKR